MYTVYTHIITYIVVYLHKSYVKLLGISLTDTRSFTINLQQVMTQFFSPCILFLIDVIVVKTELQSLGNIQFKPIIVPQSLKYSQCLHVKNDCVSVPEIPFLSNMHEKYTELLTLKS